MKRSNLTSPSESRSQRRACRLRRRQGARRPGAGSLFSHTAISALAVAGLLSLAGPTANAATFQMQNGDSIEGEIVHATRNTLMIRQPKGGVIQMSRNELRTVEIVAADGSTISGSLEGWKAGVYEIEAGDRVVKFEKGAVIEEGQLAPPILSIAAAKASESDSAITFDLALSRPAKRPILVIFATLDRSAKAGEDFEEERGSITLQPGETSAFVKVPLINDSILEDDEYFEVFVATDQNVAIIRQKRATGTILNDDTEPAADGAAEDDAEVSLQDTE